MVKPVSSYPLGDTPRLCASLRCCRSLVVLTEGRDLSPTDSESWSEICEIGKQGDLGLACLTVSTLCGTRLRVVSGQILKGVHSLVTNTGPLESAPARVRGQPHLGAVRIVVTWLILPVVICLSQRLSHACLSINKFVL